MLSSTGNSKQYFYFYLVNKHDHGDKEKFEEINLHQNEKLEKNKALENVLCQTSIILQQKKTEIDNVEGFKKCRNVEGIRELIIKRICTYKRSKGKN